MAKRNSGPEDRDEPTTDSGNWTAAPTVEAPPIDIDAVIRGYRVKPGTKVTIPADFPPDHKVDFISKEQAPVYLQRGVAALADLQSRMYAQNTYGLLVILQAMDAAGKDGAIKHVMSGINPQGVQVFSFKAPSQEELDHDYLWRYTKVMPERGRIGIFNRSYYEEVLVVRVHRAILEAQQLPPEARGKDIWARRYREINNLETYLVDNGIRVVKVFLNISKEQQRARFMARLDEPAKNWKFSANDVIERIHWDDYMAAFSEMISATSTKAAPWYVVPADRKWYARLVVAGAIIRALQEIDPRYPELDEAKRAQLAQARKILEAE